MSKADEIKEKWINGEKQIKIANDLGISRSYVSQIIKQLNTISPPNKKIYPSIVYIALKHYKRTWFKNKKPMREGKMLDEWNEMERILETEVK